MIARYAMSVAEEHYGRPDWTVENVSLHEPYDLLVHRPGQPDLHVEVKGTTGDGSQILLTPNEVSHARDHYPNVALFIVSEIRLASGQSSRAKMQALEPWRLDDALLTPIGYRYEVASET